MTITINRIFTHHLPNCPHTCIILHKAITRTWIKALWQHSKIKKLKTFVYLTYLELLSQPSFEQTNHLLYSWETPCYSPRDPALWTGPQILWPVLATPAMDQVKQSPSWTRSGHLLLTRDTLLSVREMSPRWLPRIHSLNIVVSLKVGGSDVVVLYLVILERHWGYFSRSEAREPSQRPSHEVISRQVSWVHNVSRVLHTW